MQNYWLETLETPLFQENTMEACFKGAALPGASVKSGQPGPRLLGWHGP